MILTTEAYNIIKIPIDRKQANAIVFIACLADQSQCGEAKSFSFENKITSECPLLDF